MQRLTLARQQYLMKTTLPQFRFIGRYNKAAWEGWLTPTDMSEPYLVRIDYELGKRPTITVLSPKLRTRDDAAGIPHTYPGNHPCLYWPQESEWHSGKPITIIVPWLSLWLYFYEVWHATGKWLGGGIDHGNEPKE